MKIVLFCFFFFKTFKLIFFPVLCRVVSRIECVPPVKPRTYVNYRNFFSVFAPESRR